jgi:hypothetical protein
MVSAVIFALIVVGYRYRLVRLDEWAGWLRLPR